MIMGGWSMTSLGGDCGFGRGAVPQFGEWKDRFSKLDTLRVGEEWRKVGFEEVDEARERGRAGSLSEDGEGER
jgi:hypothetical protein